jgi:hypothetical protein
MTRSRARLFFWVGTLLLVVGLPLTAHWLRGTASPRCTLDGLPITPIYQVRIVAADGTEHMFCCVRCATRWLPHEAPPHAVWVTDEATGAAIEAGAACFVRSRVVTSPITGNTIHVFKDAADADEHLQAFGGYMLTGEERPFAAP